MNRTKIILIIVFSFFVILSSCVSPSKNESTVTLGFSSDAESLNPIYAISVLEGNLSELLFLSLVQHNWNEKSASIESKPMIAKSWEWSANRKSIRLFLRNDLYWSDGERLTSKDVVFSFDIYSDKTVQSRFYGSFVDFITDDDLHIKMDETFNIISDFELIINFSSNTNPDLFDISNPILPEHILSKFTREELNTVGFNFNPVTSGAYKLVNWERNQFIKLSAVSDHFLINEESPQNIIVKIIPDYQSRLIQLENREIDFIDDVKPFDAAGFSEDSNINIGLIQGRNYDYVGWNHIDPVKFANGVKIPNKYFGNKQVRKAMSYAINRKEIEEEFLGDFGELALSPIPPVFAGISAYSTPQYEFNPQLATQILNDNGWSDTNGDGIIEKDGVNFKFNLHIPAANNFRLSAATIIKNNLLEVGVDVNIVSDENGVLVSNLYKKSYDAWLIGWSVPIPIDLRPFWHSDLDSTPLNFYSYQNSELDDLILRLESSNSDESKKVILNKMVEVIHNDEPVTFLYWIDNITAYSSRIAEIEINPLGNFQHCWNWKLIN